MPRAIVSGGGIVGLSVANALLDKGYSVTLVDPESKRSGASYGNAGHIAIEQVEPLASMAMIRSAPRRLYPRGALALPLAAARHWLPFSLRLLKAAQPASFSHGKAALSALMAEAMPAWQRLTGAMDAPDLLRMDGHFIVWESAQSAQAGMAAWLAADTGLARVRPATDTELSSLREVTTASIAGAVRFENTGQIADLPRLLGTLEAHFTARGGDMCVARVDRIAGDGTVDLADGQRLTADAVIVCAGVRSKSLLEPLGVRVPIIAERGYHIQATATAWSAGLPPVVFEDRSMIVTGFEGGLRAASFVELAGVDDAPDSGKWQKLRQHGRELGLPFDAIETAAQWMGARPTFPDYLPAIGHLGGPVYYAFGHQHLGLTLGPVTGEIVAGMVAGVAAPSAFSLERFQ